MSSADRLVVPLKSMCSMKCEMPFCPVDSRREPEPIQIPTDTLRTCGMTSVITRTPLPSVLISMFRKGLVGDVIREEGKGAYFSCSTFGQSAGAPRSARLEENVATARGHGPERSA